MNKIILFSKYPELGKVKTRLAKTIGNEKALDIYKKLLNTVVTTLKTCDFADKVIYSAQDDKINDFKKLYPTLKIKTQEGDDLGNRLINAMNNEFASLSKKVIFIGSDCIQISNAILENAFNELENNDITIGPTFDGGYYLIGLKNKCAEIFRNISWSTNKVFKQTLEIANKNNFKVSILKKLRDIDEYEDYLKFQEILM